MRRTANYQLCQWDPADRLLREDFNGDNAKIDAALEAVNPVVRLLDVTTQAAAREVDLDISGVDWSLYRELQVWLEVSTTHTDQDALLIRINQGTGYYNSLGNSTSALASLTAAPGGSVSAGRLTLVGGAHVAGFIQGISGYNSRLVENSASTATAPGGCKTLNFIMSSGMVAAGSVFKVYGVKK